MGTFLTVLWFLLVAVLWSGYLILEGFDFGVGMLLPIIGKSDDERTQLVKTIGPHWDGNEVWLLTAGGATFASSPEWYATMFSGMYLALMLVLVFLILRVGAIEWRKKVNSERWHHNWDIIHTISAWIVPVLLGVAFANLVQGMRIAIVDPKNPMQPVQEELLAKLADPAGRQAVLANHVHNLIGYDIPFGTFLSLLTPYTILGGIVVMLLFLAHGSMFLALKTTGELKLRAEKLMPKLSLVATLVTAIFALWGQLAYSSQPIFSWIPLVLAAVFLLVATGMAFANHSGKAFLFNSIGLAGAVAWIFTSMAPNVMKSTINPLFSLTMWDSSSSTATLTVMTIATVVLVPIVLAYTVWSYLVFKARITEKDGKTHGGLDLSKLREGANFLVG